MTDNYNIIPSQESGGDTIASIQLASAIDVFHKSAADLDKHMRNARIAMRENIGLTTEPRRFVLPDLDEEIAPVPFNQLSWRARGPNPDNVAQVLIRIPVLAAGRGPYPEKPKGIQEWNDLLIEVFQTDGRKARYLFNSRGIKAYPDATGLAFNFIKGESGELVATSPDIFSVVGEDAAAPQMSAKNLLDFISNPNLSSLEQQAVRSHEQQFRRRAEDRGSWRKKRK